MKTSPATQITQKEESMFALFDSILDEIDAARKAYKGAQADEAIAWKVYDLAVDECEPAEVKNELVEKAMQAEQSKSARWNDLNKAYQALAKDATLRGDEAYATA